MLLIHSDADTASSRTTDSALAVVRKRKTLAPDASASASSAMPYTGTQSSSQFGRRASMLRAAALRNVPSGGSSAPPIGSSDASASSTGAQELKSLTLGGCGLIEGYVVQAVAHGPRDIRFIENKLQLNSSCRMEGYLCTEVDSYINIVNHPTHLLIGAGTSITELPDDGHLPVHCFRPMTYYELREICDRQDEYTDYIGYLQRKDYLPTKTGDQLLKLTISNSRGRRITAALWKEVNQSADKVNRQQLETVTMPALIALASVRVTDYLGDVQLQSTPATYLYINPTGPIIDSLVQRLKERDDELSITEGGGDLPPEISDDKVTVAQLQQMDRDALIGRTLIVEGTVADLHITKGWYYNACPHCPKTAKKSGAQRGCASHGLFAEPRPTYCIGTTLTDHTATMKATLFDDAAKLLVGRECSDLIINGGYTDPTVLPDPVQAIKGKAKSFHLELQRDARPGRLSMSVNGVTEISTHALLEPTVAPQMASPAITPPTSLQVKTEPRAPEKQGVKRALHFINEEAMLAVINTPVINGYMLFTAGYAMDEEQRVSDLRHTDGGGPLYIRVLQLWRPKANNQTMRYLLIDRYGDAIEAVFSIRERAYLEPRLAIMGCYELTNYECASSPDFYRIATHTAALYIDRNLNVRRMKDDFSIPWKYFNFLTFTEIRQRALRDGQLSDYIGKVIDLEEAHIGDRRPVLRMKLQEPGNRPVVLNLPEGIYNDINLENITTIDNEVIVAATTLKVKPSPGLELNETVPQYKGLHYRAVCTVRDGTGTALVTVLAPGINDIIGYDGCQMINVKECTNTHILPDPIRALIGTKWAFMVKSFDRNLDGQLAFISNDVRPITVIMGRGQRANAGDGGN
ncbi:hypothetical protein SSX86_003724 [Deinandra increscens subsp. villosa]|uniref:Uncharacterized protein n=1 Tax=Deinandra increscens subsp. villosa TaxID=3103831 RepID=A0AAP0DHT8_9ASTR